MTNAELIQKIKAEIEERLKCNGAFDEVGDSQWHYDQGMIDAYKHMLSYIESLEQSIDADKMIGLDEAAEKYAYNNWASDDYHEGAAEGLPFDAIGHTEKCFKAGAKWMAEQGVSVDGEFGIRGVETESIVNELLNGGFKMGDKVIVQIRKK